MALQRFRARTFRTTSLAVLLTVTAIAISSAQMPDRAAAAATCTRTSNGGQCALFYTDLSGRPNHSTLTTHYRGDIRRSVALTGPGHLDATNDKLHRWHVDRSRFGNAQNRTFFKHWRACVMVQGRKWRCTPWVGAGPRHQRP